MKNKIHITHTLVFQSKNKLKTFHILYRLFFIFTSHTSQTFYTHGTSPPIIQILLDKKSQTNATE
jgi:hypothetical protein